MNKMSDGDAMVYLRNNMLALLRLAEERGIPVEIYCNPRSNFSYARAEDYRVEIYDGKIEYNYRPIGFNGKSRASEWQDAINTKSIRFGQAPKEGKWMHT